VHTFLLHYEADEVNDSESLSLQNLFYMDRRNAPSQRNASLSGLHCTTNSQHLMKITVSSNYLTQWSKVLLQKMTVAQLVNIPTHKSQMNSVNNHTSCFTLNFHLCLGLPTGPSLYDFRPLFWTFLIRQCMLHTQPIIFGNEYKLQMQGLRFSQRGIFKWRSSGLWRRVVF
jgi:hypothetical protein